MRTKHLIKTILVSSLIVVVSYVVNQRANASQTCGCTDPRPFSCDASSPCPKVGNCRSDYCPSSPGDCAGCGGSCNSSADCSSNQTRWYDCEPLEECGQCSCPSCTNSAPNPSPFSLISPLNCTVLNPSTASVNLTWNAIAGWGTNCGTQANSYKVYVDSVNNPPAVASLSGSVASNVTSYAYNNWLRGQRYYWRVEATNGALSSWSNVGCFDITPAPKATLSVAVATASDTLIPLGTAPTTGGLYYSSIVGDRLRVTVNGSQVGGFLNSVQLFDRAILPTGGWSSPALLNAPCTGVTPCLSLSNNTYYWTVKAGTTQLVVNARNNNAVNGGLCTGNPDPAAFPYTASGTTFFDCSTSLEGQQDIVTVRSIPTRTVSGNLYRTNVINACGATTSVTDSDNTAQLTLRYTFNSVTTDKLVNLTFPDPSFSFNVPDGSILNSICVTNLSPDDGAYTISCVADNPYPTGSMCYSYPANTVVNGAAVQTNLGFYMHTQSAWYTTLDADIYTVDAINQSIPDGAAPFSGVLLDSESSSQKSYAFSSSNTISSGDGTNNIYITGQGGYAAGLGSASNFYYVADPVTTSDISSFPTLNLNDLEGVDTSTHKLFKSSDFSVGTTTYDISYNDSLPGDTAVVYVTPGNGEGVLSFTGNFEPGSPANSGRLLFYVIGTGLEFGPKTQIIGQPLIGVNVFNNVANDVQAGFITTGSILVQGSGASSDEDDNTIVVKGILAGNSIRIKRTRGFINNETRPALVSRYDAKYLYDLTYDLREGSVDKLPGLSLVDITWSEE